MKKSPLPDDSNWREDYKQFTSDKRDLQRLEEGAKKFGTILASASHV